MQKGYSPKKAKTLMKGFKDKDALQRLWLEGERNEDAILSAQEAFGEVMRLEDDEGRLRVLRKK